MHLLEESHLPPGFGVFDDLEVLQVAWPGNWLDQRQGGIHFFGGLVFFKAFLCLFFFFLFFYRYLDFKVLLFGHTRRKEEFIFFINRSFSEKTPQGQGSPDPPLVPGGGSGPLGTKISHSRRFAPGNFLLAHDC